ncbi:MAG: 2-phosphosulfolactate phosphatase [Verrucomicrobia bacterium]|nr:2-phosphosulfolactate phosphatase [Verrucomicrobiota bacterium]
MNSSLEVLFAPAEFAALKQRDLSQTTCVVFDILRATTSMITALANGAREIIPVGEIAEALALRAQQPEILLAGERDGLRIRAAQTGSVDFDLGNSPREFTAERVRGKTIAITTTNGTRALRACAHAEMIWIASFLNLGVVAARLEHDRPVNLLLVCSGTIEQASFEDTLATGALVDLLWAVYASGQVADSATMARQIFQPWRNDLLGAMQQASNGRKLLANPDLRDDVEFCVRRDTVSLLATLQKDGRVISASR